MRGDDRRPDTMFSYVSMEARILVPAGAQRQDPPDAASGEGGNLPRKGVYCMSLSLRSQP